MSQLILTVHVQSFFFCIAVLALGVELRTSGSRALILLNSSRESLASRNTWFGQVKTPPCTTELCRNHIFRATTTINKSYAKSHRPNIS